MFKRKIYDKLLEWKKMSGGTSAVMLEGARRICKSTIAETFAQNEYKDYFIIDFAKANKDIKNNIKVTTLLYVIGVIAGIVLECVGLKI